MAMLLTWPVNEFLEPPFTAAESPVAGFAAWLEGRRLLNAPGLTPDEFFDVICARCLRIFLTRVTPHLCGPN